MTWIVTVSGNPVRPADSQERGLLGSGKLMLNSRWIFHESLDVCDRRPKTRSRHWMSRWKGDQQSSQCLCVRFYAKRISNVLIEFFTRCFYFFFYAKWWQRHMFYYVHGIQSSVFILLSTSVAVKVLCGIIKIGEKIINTMMLLRWSFESKYFWFLIRHESQTSICFVNMKGMCRCIQAKNFRTSLKSSL